uniref:G_PROTEIN_RECEP_F2_4 domain-containing protein n=1 Tax=Elaeophora elaphi TaxID=1147741 RepID=A0A158Q868_9BILA
MEHGNINCAQRYGYSYTEKMYLFLCMLFLLVLSKSPPCYATKENSGRSERAVGHNEQYIKQIFYTHANCIHTDWACNEECRLEYVNRSTGLCIPPSPTETCFGIPIRYNYTFETASVIAALPKYEVLSKFPRCWSALGPLLCAVAYRPCSNRAYFEVSMDKPGKMELWQVFRKDMCQKAIEKCNFLLENGLWPSFVNCSDTIKSKDGRRIFSNGSCLMAYNKEPSKMEPKQCLWPLAVGISHSKPMARPFIDDCYLPCRSPLISSQWIYDGFRTLIFSVSLLITVGGLICTSYLFIFSLLYTSDLCVYSLTHALLSASIHWFIWLLSYADRVAERAMCFDMLRRDAKVLRGLLDWCSIQFWLLHTTILSGFFWLLIVLAIQIGGPKLTSDQTIKWNKYIDLNIRCFFLICYLVAGSFATVALWADAIETNGITGVCYFGFYTIRSTANLYGPVLIFFMFLFAVVYFRKRNEDATKIVVSNDSEKRDQVALVVDHVDDVDKGLFDCDEIKKSGYSQMAFFWRSLLCIITTLSFVASAILIHYSFFTGAISEQEAIMDSVRCSLNKTVMEGQTEWLHGIVRDLKTDIFSRRASIGSSFLSAPGCELPSSVDDQLLPIFLLYLFFPSLPFITVIMYVFTGFCGYGMIGIEKVRRKFNPFVLVKYSEFALVTRKQQTDNPLITGTSNLSGKLDRSQTISIKKCENISQSEKDEEESRDIFPTDLKIGNDNTLPGFICFSIVTGECHLDVFEFVRLFPDCPFAFRLDVLQRSRERRRRQMESGCLFLSPMDSVSMTTSVLSAYQNGLVEGHWRERCVNYEKQIKALSANLRVADHEIRRLAGLQISESMIASRKRKFPYAAHTIDMNNSFIPNAADRSPLISTKFRLHQSPTDAKSLVVDKVNHSRNLWGENVKFSKSPTSSHDNFHMQNKPQIDEGNETKICQMSSLKPRTFFGTSATQGPSEIANDGHLSESYHDSDSFNSDEEDSEEERLYNEKVAELQRRQQ